MGGVAVVRVPLTVLYVGVFGEPRMESAEGYLRDARWMGRKMPAPGMEVLK